MKPRFERRITPRGYEMNAAGSVPPAVLARYGEHVRWDGLRDSEYGLNRCWQRGVIRAQRLQTFEPLQYGAELNVVLWVSRVGRTSFDLATRLERVGIRDNALVALIAVTVVNLGPDNRPAPLAPEAADFVAEHPLPSAETPAEEPPSAPYVRELSIAPSDQDVLQHVNHARYIDFVEDTYAFAERAGAYGENAPALGQRPRSWTVEYDREATFGEGVSVLTWASATPGAYEFQIRRTSDSVVLTRARLSFAV